jgi:acyl-homoserine lactone acylase PvdQ
MKKHLRCQLPEVASFFVLLILLSTSCQKTELSEIQHWQARASNVNIIRDDFGIPHIYAKSDADAVFGLLYAQCEDDFRRVERNYIWATGRLAELEGEEALYSDLRAKLYMTEEEAKAAYTQAPQWLKDLCIAFADGVNYYLHTHPEVKPQVITRYEAWFPMYFSEGSIGGDIESVSTRKIKSFYGQHEAGRDIGDLLTSDAEEPRGSNGIAIAGTHTKSGKAMLLINPHTSFYFRPEVHVVSDEGLNAYGAVTWGQFFIYQGFNEKTGWMHTSTFVDFIDEFVEETVEQDGKRFYKYGTELRPVEEIAVALHYKSADTLATRNFTMYRTHHGPITHQTEDGKWVATKINWDPVNALIQSYTRTKLNNYAGFREMMNIRTNSSNNTVFADAEGNIAYFHGNFIPRRNPGYDFSKPVDGSDPATDWLGLHTVEESITLLNPPNGWIQNCNSTPFTAAAEFSPKREDYPPYMAPDAENFRGVHAVRLLSKIDKIDMDELISLAYDPYLAGFEYMIPPLLEAYRKEGAKYPNLREPIAVLEAWDYRTSLSSEAMSLAHFYAQGYSRSIGNPIRLIDEPTARNVAPERQLETLAEAVNRMIADYGHWRKPWGEINRFQRLSGDIDLQFDDSKESIPVGMASARWGALASYGSFSKGDAKKLYGTLGNSFVAVVEFGDKVKAKSILAGGQSANPDSPHFYDQANRYAEAKFKDVAFYREDVEKRARRKYRPGE